MERGGARPCLRPGDGGQAGSAPLHDCEVNQAAAFAMYSRAQSPSTFADGYAAIVTS